MSVRRLAAHLARVALVAALVALVRDQHHWLRSRELTDASTLTIEQARQVFPGAQSLGPVRPDDGRRSVLDGAGAELGSVLQTSPEADEVVGYSGPTNVLVGVDRAGLVVGIAVLSSGDTRDHARQVRDDTRFATALRGEAWRRGATWPEVDAVSGATLTSVAILEGLRLRLDGDRTPLKFPDPPRVEELAKLLPAARRLVPRDGRSEWFDVLGEDESPIGSVVRTSPVADAIRGYQGPTDTLVVLDAAGRTVGLVIRGSYDNDREVGYVRDDYAFPDVFTGRTVAELAALQDAGIEGVSGATMTSQAIVAAVARAAESALVPSPPARRRPWLSRRDWAPLAGTVCGLLLAFTRWRPRGGWRGAYLVAVVAVLGFLSGDMLSQALFVGWARHGIPWSLAPGLAALALVSVVVPACSKQQVYCQHLCPFGALQQLARHRLPWRVRLPERLRRALRALPALLLAVVLVVAMRGLPFNLASLEPFDAFVFWVAGPASVALAVVGLAFSTVSPMAYCRFGCPTGAALEYLRRHQREASFHRADLAALLLLLIALALRLAR